jgi:hypothetical protein
MGHCFAHISYPLTNFCSYKFPCNHEFLYASPPDSLVSLASIRHAGFLRGIFFIPENGDDVSPKRQLTFIALHGLIASVVRI